MIRTIAPGLELNTNTNTNTNTKYTFDTQVKGLERRAWRPWTLKRRVLALAAAAAAAVPENITIQYNYTCYTKTATTMQRRLYHRWRRAADNGAVLAARLFVNKQDSDRPHVTATAGLQARCLKTATSFEGL